MNLLAVDTSSTACSVALQLDGETALEHREEPRAHTRILIPMIEKLMADADLRYSQLDALVLGNGPGSFIGMRIGASVCQGLAVSADLPLVTVSSLAAVAQACLVRSPDAGVVVAQDARMEQVYVGFFRGDANGCAAPLVDEQIRRVDALRLPDSTGQWLAAGRAWQQFAELGGTDRNRITIADVEFPRADMLLPIANDSLQRGDTVAPEQLQPAYLRVEVATVPAS